MTLTEIVTQLIAAQVSREPGYGGIHKVEPMHVSDAVRLAKIILKECAGR